MENEIIIKEFHDGLIFQKNNKNIAFYSYSSDSLVDQNQKGVNLSLCEWGYLIDKCKEYKENKIK